MNIVYTVCSVLLYTLSIAGFVGGITVITIRWWVNR